MDKKKPKKYERRRLWVYLLVAAAVLTAISAVAEAGTNRPFRYYTDSGNTAFTYYTNGSGENISYWGINTDNPQCEFDINGTICINRTGFYYSGVNITPSADGNNYPTSLAVNQTNGNYTIQLGRNGLSTLSANFVVNSTGGTGGGGINGVTINNGTGINVSGNGTTFTVGVANLQTCNAVTEYSVWNGSHWLCDNDGSGGGISGVTVTNPDTFLNLTSNGTNIAGNINFTSFDLRYVLKTLYDLFTSDIYTNVTALQNRPTGNITGRIVSGEGVYAYNNTELRTNKILYVEPNNGTDFVTKAAIGGIVIVPPGNYTVNTTLAIPSNTIIQGSGYSTLINYNGTSNVLSSTDKNNIIIKEIRINHNAAPNNHAIRLNRINNLTIIRVWSENAGHHNIWINGSKNVLVEGNYVDGAGKDGINDGVGIVVGSTQGKLTITNNFVRDTGYHGIQGHDNDAELIITNNHIEDVGNINSASSFIMAQLNSKKVIISNNIGQDSASGGIALDTINQSVISGNVLSDMVLDGISIIDSNNTVISSNSIQNTSRAGIYLKTNSYKTTVIGNTIADTIGNGIWVTTNKYFTIQSNTINNVTNTSGGIVIEGSSTSDFIINGNNIYGGKYGVRLTTNGQDRYIITNNFAYNNDGSFTDITDQANGVSRYISGNIVTNGSTTPSINTFGSGSIYPQSNNTYILGNSTNSWSVLNAETIRGYGNSTISGSLTIGVNLTVATGNVASKVSLSGDRGTIVYDGSYIQIIGGTNKGVELFGNASSSRVLRVNQAGTMIILNGTTATQLLDVRGNINTTGIIYTPQLCLNGDCRTAWPTGGAGGGNFSEFRVSNSTSTTTLYNNSLLTIQAGSNVVVDQTAGTFTISASVTGSSGNVSGNGSAGYLARWEGSTGISNSSVYENGNNIQINKTNLLANGKSFDRVGLNYMYPLSTEFCDSTVNNGGTGGGFVSTAISSGVVAFVGTALQQVNHPCIMTISDSTSANGGAQFGAGLNDGLLLNGSEETRMIFKTYAGGSKGNITIRFGFSDSSTITAPTDGVYMEFNMSVGATTPFGTNTLQAFTRSNSVESSNATLYTFSNATWYIASVGLNDAGNQAYYKLYNESGTLLWNTTLSTNIPTGANRMTAQKVIATQASTDAGAVILNIDYMDFTINRPVRNILLTG